MSVPDEGYYERTWWRLFWAYLMKVIMSVPDEGYSERHLMKVIMSVPDEGYYERTWWRLFWAYLMKVIMSIPDEGYYECTWWRLFQKLIVCTKFDILVSIKVWRHFNYKMYSFRSNKFINFQWHSFIYFHIYSSFLNLCYFLICIMLR